MLVLEDQEARQVIFRELYSKEYHVRIVDTADACIKALKVYDWDVLYLDHDLGIDGTGYDVACWLEEHKDKQRGLKIYLHTGNPVGKAKMKAALPDAIEINFKDLK